MNAWYATNGRNLLDARRNGLLPTGPVIVSLVGGEFTETALYVRPEMPTSRLDWRMLVNLEVWVWANTGAALGWVLDTTLAIATARPRDLHVRFEGPDQRMHDVAVGRGFHHTAVQPPPGAGPAIPAHHEFWWCPINVGGTAVGKNIRNALKAKQQADTLL